MQQEWCESSYSARREQARRDLASQLRKDATISTGECLDSAWVILDGQKFRLPGSWHSEALRCQR